MLLFSFKLDKKILYMLFVIIFIANSIECNAQTSVIIEVLNAKDFINTSLEKHLSIPDFINSLTENYTNDKYIIIPRSSNDMYVFEIDYSNLNQISRFIGEAARNNITTSSYVFNEYKDRLVKNINHAYPEDIIDYSPFGEVPSQSSAIKDSQKLPPIQIDKKPTGVWFWENAKWFFAIILLLLISFAAYYVRKIIKAINPNQEVQQNESHIKPNFSRFNTDKIFLNIIIIVVISIANLLAQNIYVDNTLSMYRYRSSIKNILSSYLLTSKIASKNDTSEMLNLYLFGDSLRPPFLIRNYSDLDKAVDRLNFKDKTTNFSDVFEHLNKQKGYSIVISDFKRDDNNNQAYGLALNNLIDPDTNKTTPTLNNYADSKILPGNYEIIISIIIVLFVLFTVVIFLMVKNKRLRKNNLIIPQFVLIKNDNKKEFPEGVTTVKLGNALWDDIYMDEEISIELEYHPSEKEIIIRQRIMNGEVKNGK